MGQNCLCFALFRMLDCHTSANTFLVEVNLTSPLEGVVGAIGPTQQRTGQDGCQRYNMMLTKHHVGSLGTVHEVA